MLFLLLPFGAETTCANSTSAARGADVTVTALPGVDLRPAMSLPGLLAASGPFPGAPLSLRSGGREAGVWLEGRAREHSPVAPVALASGEWMELGEVVVPQSVASSLRVRVGSHVTVPGRNASLRVAGITPDAPRRSAGSALPAAYVVKSDLTHAGVATWVRGSTVFLQLAPDSDRSALVSWLNRRYPGPQAEVSTRGCV
jgi:hypothetical protein